MDNIVPVLIAALCGMWAMLCLFAFVIAMFLSKTWWIGAQIASAIPVVACVGLIGSSLFDNRGDPFAALSAIFVLPWLGGVLAPIWGAAALGGWLRRARTRKITQGAAEA
jgi:hypothetical protein